jgi:hypothetical protein
VGASNYRRKQVSIVRLRTQCITACHSVGMAHWTSVSGCYMAILAQQGEHSASEPFLLAAICCATSDKIVAFANSSSPAYHSQPPCGSQNFAANAGDNSLRRIQQSVCCAFSQVPQTSSLTTCALHALGPVVALFTVNRLC